MLKAKAPTTDLKCSNISLGSHYIVGPLARQNDKSDQEIVSTVTALNQLQGLRDGLQPKEDVELCDWLVSPYVHCTSLPSQ